MRVLCMYMCDCGAYACVACATNAYRTFNNPNIFVHSIRDGNHCIFAACDTHISMQVKLCVDALALGVTVTVSHCIDFRPSNVNDLLPRNCPLLS